MTTAGIPTQGAPADAGAASSIGEPPAGVDHRFSPPLGLWCPYCRTPFVGSVNRVTGQFAHGSCPVAELDVSRLDALAQGSWFWDRFRERLRA